MENGRAFLVVGRGLSIRSVLKLGWLESYKISASYLETCFKIYLNIEATSILARVKM